MAITDILPIAPSSSAPSSSGDSAQHRPAGTGLRKLAADETCRTAFAAPDSVLRQVLAPAARRYVVADNRDDLLSRVAILRRRGYRTALEFVGEEITDPAAIEEVVQEYLDLIEADPGAGQLGFDLSAVGHLISRDLAVRNTSRICEAAAARGSEVIISMERSGSVGEILQSYTELAARHGNVGITIQAHLHRTEADLARVVPLGGKIRLVKGVYTEPPEVALARGPGLDARYLRLAEQIVRAGGRVALATHDAAILARAEDLGLLDEVEEIEMLHGVQPALLRRYREANYPCRVYATYGTNWWLHLLHRLAEHPPMALTALGDLADPDRVVFAEEY